MLMTTKKLILLRIFNISLGRFSFFSKLLKRVLIRSLILNKKETYSSGYFGWIKFECDSGSVEKIRGELKKLNSE